MTFSLLKLLHLLGAVIMVSGLIGVWLADLRTRQVRDLGVFAESVRYIRVFYDGLTLPGALLLLVSGALLIAFYYGSGFLQVPWLAGMMALFLAEFVEGNTVTRRAFVRLGKETEKALAAGRFTPELIDRQQRQLPMFTHYLDLPLVSVIIMLGVLRPDTWDLLIAGTLVAFFIAGTLTLLLPQLLRQGDKRHEPGIPL